MKPPLGCSRWKATVLSSTFTTPSGTKVPPKIDSAFEEPFGSHWDLKLYMTSSTVIGLPSLNFTPWRILKVHTVASALGFQLSASHGWYFRWWSVKTRNSPTWSMHSMPPWSAMVIGLMAAVGTTAPTLIVAPLLPAGVEAGLGGAELPHAARMPPSSGNDSPAAVPCRRKALLDRHPATNSSMTCSWIGPRPLRRV